MSFDRAEENELNDKISKQDWGKGLGILQIPPDFKVIEVPPSSVDIYKDVLQATQDVFGEENMTVDVMIEAIKVGGSIALLKD